jgi:hypothetical protein
MAVASLTGVLLLSPRGRSLGKAGEEDEEEEEEEENEEEKEEEEEIKERGSVSPLLLILPTCECLCV